MAFRKAIVAKTLDLVEAALGKVGRVAARDHARDHFFLQRMDGALAPEGGHGAAQLIGLLGGKFRRFHGDAHGLFLEQRHALGLAQDLAQLVRRPVLRIGRGIGFGFEAVAPAQVGMHHVALNGTGADDRHLDDEIVEAARF